MDPGVIQFAYGRVKVRSLTSSIVEVVHRPVAMNRITTVALELIAPGGGPWWATRVGFYAGAKPVLGHAGFLDHFTAKFNGRAKLLTLTPNGTAPPASA